MRLFLWLAILIIFNACSLKSYLKKSLDSNPALKNSFTGLVIYDPEKDNEIINVNGSRYFTPGSNTKLFTFYAGFKILGDSVPALYYRQTHDSLIIWGSGDPSFLHPDLMTSKVYRFLIESETPIYLSNANYFEKPLGPGWAWDDAYFRFSTERSYFPIYGNYFKVLKDSSGWKAAPDFFSQFITIQSVADSAKIEIRRFSNDNLVGIEDSRSQKSIIKDVPFIVSDSLVKFMLEDTLAREVQIVDIPLKEYNTLYSIPVDSVLLPMLQQSDNFLAEQLLVIYSGILSDSISSKIGIDRITELYLPDSPEKLIWRDGSGLSRYNLFTPNSIIYLLRKIYGEIPTERLFKLLPAGGESGTIKNWYSANPPYIFAKTGTLSNNHNLSGYLITKNNKVLIFSFMHNHYEGSSSKVKKVMEELLWQIHLRH